MKNKNVIKYFSFDRLEYFKDYDRYTEKLLFNLIRIHPEITEIISLIKKSNLNVDDKITVMYAQFRLVFYPRYNEDELSYFAERIGQYLFEGREEYKYRKQFSE